MPTSNTFNFAGAFRSYSSCPPSIAHPRTNPEATSRALAPAGMSSHEALVEALVDQRVLVSQEVRRQPQNRGTHAAQKSDGFLDLHAEVQHAD